MKTVKGTLKALVVVVACLIMLLALPVSTQAAGVKIYELKQHGTDILGATVEFSGYDEELSMQGHNESYSIEGGYLISKDTLSGIDYATHGSKFTISKAPNYNGTVRCFVETYVIEGDNLSSVRDNFYYVLGLDSTKGIGALDGSMLADEGWYDREITTIPVSFDFALLYHDKGNANVTNPIDMGRKDVIHIVHVYFSDNSTAEDNKGDIIFNTRYELKIRVVGGTAKSTASTVLVNGKNTAFDAYTIEGNNYFKLRDLAYTLSGTEKEYDVSWDGAKNAISLTSDKAYTPVGGEMTSNGSGDKAYTPTTSIVYLNDEEVKFTAYTIDGNNYFKLRDIGKALDFAVDWDGVNNSIFIDTTKGYTEQTTDE